MTTETKKILFIIQLPPPMHGVSMMNSYIFKSELINNNFAIDVVDLKFSSSINELQKLSFLKVFKTIYYGYKIVQKILTQKPDLVYFTLCPTGLAFYRDSFYVFLLKLMRSKIVYHLHGKGIRRDSEKSSLKKHLYKWVFKNTQVICLSERLKEDVRDVYDSVPYVVPNGIEVQPKIAGELNRVKRSVPQLLCLSNYIRNKGILVLIDALYILKNNGYLFNARLVGAPSDLTVEFLNNVIDKLNLKDVVTVVGPLFGNDKFSEFQKADIFVFPTYNDVFGLVNLEAMQFSLPVISTFEGSIPDVVIDNSTGFIVETQNAQMLAEKTAILLEDENLRLEMGKNGYERFINNYTLDHFEKRMNKTFCEILA